MVTTKIYQNNGKEAVNVIGLGEIPAGEHLSVTSEYHQPVVLANYPTVVELVDEEQKAEAEKLEAPVETQTTREETTNGQNL
jgi:hypothetical protein